MIEVDLIPVTERDVTGDAWQGLKDAGVKVTGRGETTCRDGWENIRAPRGNLKWYEGES